MITRWVVLALVAVLAVVLLVNAGSWDDAVPGILVALAIIGLYGFWRSRSRHPASESVTYDERQIVRHVPDGTVERICWDELDRISIITTDQGPWNEDAYWIFEDAARQKGCMIGNGAEGFPALLDHISSFGGFSHERVIEAMGCTSNKRFIIWNRSDDSTQAPPAVNADEASGST